MYRIGQIWVEIPYEFDRKKAAELLRERFGIPRKSDCRCVHPLYSDYGVNKYGHVRANWPRERSFRFAEEGYPAYEYQGKLRPASTVTRAWGYYTGHPVDKAEPGVVKHRGKSEPTADDIAALIWGIVQGAKE